MNKIRQLFLILPFMVVLLLAAACSGLEPGTDRAPVAVQVPAGQSAGGPLKINVVEAGMYELTWGDLEPYGLAEDPQALRLSHRGRPQPLWVAGEGKDLAVRFYAQASQSRYAAANVYWLAAGDGPESWMAQGTLSGQTSGGAVGEIGLATVRVEENQRYSPKVESGDYFLWTTLAATGSHAIEVSLPEVAQGAGQVRVEVWANTQAPQDPDHRMRVVINDQMIADQTWDGLGRFTLEEDIPPSVLQSGVNQVLVEAPGGIDVAADVFMLDWVEIDYPRPLAAESDRLAFDGSASPLQLTGFKGPVEVFDVSDPDAVVRLGGVEADGGTAVVATESGRRYLAVGPGGYKRPEQLVPAQTNPDLLGAGLGADYVAIGPADLLVALGPLIDRRNADGLQAVGVPLAAVYDQFNHGLPEPEAIQAFMVHAAQAWDPAPAYLLLVGDASYDPRGYQAPPEANRLPTFLVDTVFGGETASDIPFGQLDDDPWSEIAIGRLPARDAKQVEIAVGKILAYEKALLAGDWGERIVAVADGQSGSFQIDAQRFLDRFSEDFDRILYAPAAGQADSSQQVRAHFEEGSLLVAYFGHGSVTQWGKDKIFTTENVTGLGNGDRLPVVVNMTCLTGLFTHPEVASLAETLLWEPGGGAVAVLAPTSLTLPTDQSFLSDALVDALMADPNARLGDVSQQAREQVPVDNEGGLDVMQTFLLFGDPAMRMQLRGDS
jgi:hypothetical protein